MLINKSTTLLFKENLDINKLRILDYILGKICENGNINYENKVYEISFEDFPSIFNLKEQYSKKIIADFVKTDTNKPILFKNIQIFELLSYWISHDIKLKKSYVEIECKFTDDFFKLLTKGLIFCYNIKNKINLNSSLAFIFYDYLKVALKMRSLFWWYSNTKETSLEIPLEYLKGFTIRHTPAYLKIQLNLAISLINKHTDIEIYIIKDIKIGNKLIGFYLVIKEKKFFRETIYEYAQTCSL